MKCNRGVAAGEAVTAGARGRDCRKMVCGHGSHGEQFVCPDCKAGGHDFSCPECGQTEEYT